MYDRSLLGLGGGYVLGAGDGIALGDVSMGGSGSVASVSKNDWKYREMLIIQYITSIKVSRLTARSIISPLFFFFIVYCACVCRIWCGARRPAQYSLPYPCNTRSTSAHR